MPLESERLLYRPHLITDLDDYCAMEMDLHVRRYVGGYPRTREEAERRFPKSTKDKLSLKATVLKKENLYIGRSGLYPHIGPDGRTIDGEANLSYYIAHAYWGQGFATEAGRTFIHLGFHELALRRIVTAVEEGNDASMRVLEKLGFAVTFIERGPRTFYHFALENPLPQIRNASPPG